MSHQPMYVWNAEKKKSDKVSFETVPVDKAWAVGHYAGYKKPSSGRITIQEHDEGALGGAYLECSVDDRPFLSIKSSIDQWGTWYNFKLSSDSNEEETEYEYAFEWGRKSFLYSLAEAIKELADKSEPPPK